MDDALGVGVREGVGHLGGERDRVVHGEPGVASEPRAQRLALDEGHHEVRRLAAGAVVHRAGIEDGKDVRVLQPCGELDLAEEPGYAGGAAQLRPDDLDRHRPAVSQVLREEDRRHAARADLTLERVALAERGRQASEGIGHG